MNLTASGGVMALDLLKDKGVPLEQQRFTWKELVQPTYSKLDDDAFTRVRVILMNGIEPEALRFSHACARMNGDLQLALARVRRVEQHQQTLVNWLNPADQSPLETTIGFEQVAIEVTASVAESEPDPYLAQVYRFGLLEDFDHMYRYAALMDRVEGKDANTLVQSYSDILPGRPTSLDIETPAMISASRTSADQAALMTKLHALTIMAGNIRPDYYMTIGPMFADPTARQLYAEIASIEEQHVTQYESIIDAKETCRYGCCTKQPKCITISVAWTTRIIHALSGFGSASSTMSWGHLRFVADLFEQTEKRDAAEVLSTSLPKPIRYDSHREFVRATLRTEVTECGRPVSSSTGVRRRSRPETTAPT
jgi:hypothetical protein